MKDDEIKELSLLDDKQTKLLEWLEEHPEEREKLLETIRNVMEAVGEALVKVAEQLTPTIKAIAAACAEGSKERRGRRGRLMPNWIEGTIKLRGSYEDLKRFVNEGLEPMTIAGKQVGTKEDLIDLTDYGSEFDFEIKDHDMWISGTRRAFIKEGPYGTSTGSDDDNLILVLNVRQAWSFLAHDTDQDKWKSISDKFNIDIRLYGYEMGVEFCEEVIILRGKGIILDNVIKFEDWNWDCPFPNLGG